MSRTGRLFDMKRQGDKIVMLTAYDAPTAQAVWQAGVDLILVGDSVGTNVLGYDSEREVTLADILHHLRAVRRGAPDASIVADLPYATYETAERAVANARDLIAAGADMVKFEGARPDIATALTTAGIAVSGHLGLEPQHHEEKRLKAKSAQAALQLETDAKLLDNAGVGLIILELIPEEIAARITTLVRAPTIGIGAGRGTDGQVLVVNDALGSNSAAFRHNRRFAEVGASLRDGAAAYCRAVRSGEFPAEENVFRMPKAELALLEDAS